MCPGDKLVLMEAVQKSCRSWCSRNLVTEPSAALSWPLSMWPWRLQHLVPKGSASLKESENWYSAVGIKAMYLCSVFSPCLCSIFSSSVFGRCLWSQCLVWIFGALPLEDTFFSKGCPAAGSWERNTQQESQSCCLTVSAVSRSRACNREGGEGCGTVY